MTAAELARLEALENAAAPGPWMYSAERCEVDTAQIGRRDGHTYDSTAWGPLDEDGDYDVDLQRANARFIASARTAVPALAQALREARALLEEAAKALDDLHASAINGSRGYVKAYDELDDRIRAHLKGGE